MIDTPESLIRRKRDGHELSPDQLRGFVAGVTDGSIPDYQVSAFLMAVFFRGMTDAEQGVLTDAMLRSGEVMDFASLSRPTVDKHSTGGVGDKISIPLAPVVAACGAAVPMISGRGLGHTGGTLDKLESIPGFRVDIATERFRQLVDEIGCAMIGQTGQIAPADKRLYALRDVTATVESVPLIAASIMSKKLAEGIDGLVLDCKVGDGAFMPTLDRGRELAQAIAAIGKACDTKVTVVMTDMNTPIGTMVGNSLEVLESIEVLRGEGPADTRELTEVLGAEMLMVAGIESESNAARERIRTALGNGRALDTFRRMVEAQGGDPKVADKPDAVLPRAREKTAITAPRGGRLAGISARKLGVAALRLGAGRRTHTDDVDPAVGVELAVKVGSDIEPGQTLCYLHHNSSGLDEASELANQAFKLADEASAHTSSDTPSTRILETLR